MKNKAKAVFLSAAILIFLLFGSSNAQFRLAVGGPFTDESHSLVQATDGGIVVAGNTQSYGIPSQNSYLVKFTTGGALQWSKAIGGVSTDEAFTIIKTSDGGYATAGWTFSYGAGGYDFNVMKLDASGNLQWYKTIGGAGSDYGCSIVQTSDGGYAVAGHTNSFGMGNVDVMLVKLSSSGALQWCKTAGGPAADYAYSLTQSSDGGFVVAGSTMSYGSGSNDIYVVKFNSSGIAEWGKTVGGSSTDAGISIKQASDGGYIIAGSTMSFGAGNFDMYIVKINSAGTLAWTRTLGGSVYEFASSVVQTSDGGYIVAGSTESFGAGASDIYIAKLNSSGVLQWQKTSGGSGDDYGFTVIQTTDGGYCVTGNTESYGTGNTDIFLLKFGSNGTICGSSQTPSGTSGSGGALYTLLPVSLTYTPTVTSPAPIVLSGGSVTALCLTGIEYASNEIPNDYSLSQNYPNPFNPVTNIKFSIPNSGIVTLKVYDITGKQTAELVNQNLNAGSYTVDFDASHLSSGTYFYRLSTEGFTDVKKMILVK